MKSSFNSQTIQNVKPRKKCCGFDFCGAQKIQSPKPKITKPSITEPANLPARKKNADVRK